jgi:phage-related protein
MNILKFEIEFLEDAIKFLRSLDEKVINKVIYNIDKAKHHNDPKLFKKLNDNIWEFRTEFNTIQYRFLAFWDKTDNKNVLVIASNGFVKKKDKVPDKEINKAENLRKLYFGIK